MARKPGFGSDIAATVLANAQAVSGPRPHVSVLASRSQAISKFGKDIQYEQFEWLDPSVCRPSAQNARKYDELTFENCAELIDSLKSEGRQRFAAVVRRTDDPDVPFEIVAGSRRHFAISWLRANNYPDFQYLVDIQTMDDEAAFRLSDLENRPRSDITDIERSESYLAALEIHYQGSVSLMSERLNLTAHTLRRYLELAKLDGNIIAALGGRRAANVNHARDIKPDLAKSDAHAERIINEAKRVAEIQATRLAKSEKAMPAPDVIKLLKAAATNADQKKKGAVKPMVVLLPGGDELFSYIPPNRRAGLSIKIPAKFNGSSISILAEITKIIEKTYKT